MHNRKKRGECRTPHTRCIPSLARVHDLSMVLIHACETADAAIIASARTVQYVQVPYSKEMMAASATPVRHFAVPLRRSPRLAAQRRPSAGPSTLIGLLNRDIDRDPTAVGAKRSYHEESGDSGASKHPRLQLNDSRFIDSLMLSVTGENTFPTLNFSRCSSGVKELLVVTTCKLAYHEPAGYLSRLRLIVDSNQGYKVQVNVHINFIMLFSYLD